MLIQILTQLEVIYANIRGLHEDVKELGEKVGHLEVDVDWTKKHL